MPTECQDRFGYGKKRRESERDTREREAVKNMGKRGTRESGGELFREPTPNLVHRVIYNIIGPYTRRAITTNFNGIDSF